jgi:hypothetical protein
MLSIGQSNMFRQMFERLFANAGKSLLSLFVIRQYRFDLTHARQQ